MNTYIVGPTRYSFNDGKFNGKVSYLTKEIIFPSFLKYLNLSFNLLIK